MYEAVYQLALNYPLFTKARTTSAEKESVTSLYRKTGEVGWLLGNITHLVSKSNIDRPSELTKRRENHLIIWFRDCLIYVTSQSFSSRHYPWSLSSGEKF